MAEPRVLGLGVVRKCQREVGGASFGVPDETGVGELVGLEEWYRGDGADGFVHELYFAEFLAL